MNKVILDANVYVKLFKQEPDSQMAVDLMERLVQSRAEIIEPSVVVNETITTCEYNKQDLHEVAVFFEVMLDSSIRLVEVDSSLFKVTLAFTKEGHEKSGYPTFNDSMYQALAEQEECAFHHCG